MNYGNYKIQFLEDYLEKNIEKDKEYLIDKGLFIQNYRNIN